MTPRLEAIKEQPLLNAPSPNASEWWEVTPEHEKVISRWMSGFRKANNPGSMLSDFYMMRELGFAERITDEEAERANASLQSFRRNESGYEIARIHHYMRLLGRQSDCTERDKELIRRETSHGAKFQPMEDFMQLLHMATELGVIGDVNRNRQELDQYLVECRKVKSGMELAAAIHYSRKLGIPVEVTDDDRREMREHLLSEKPFKLADHTLARMYFYLRDILPEAGKKAEASPMPTLKRFGGGE